MISLQSPCSMKSLERGARRMTAACLNMAYGPLACFLFLFHNPWHNPWHHPAVLLLVLAVTKIWLIAAFAKLVSTAREHGELREDARTALQALSPSVFLRITPGQRRSFRGHLIGAAANGIAGVLLVLLIHAMWEHFEANRIHFSPMMPVMLYLSAIVLAVSWLPASLAWLIAAGRDASLARQLSRP